jgi:hypothetical protein
MIMITAREARPRASHPAPCMNTGMAAGLTCHYIIGALVDICKWDHKLPYGCIMGARQKVPTTGAQVSSMAEEGTEDPLAAAVLDANTAFYAAFSNGDADSMTALWADEQDVRSQLRALRAAAVLLPD